MNKQEITDKFYKECGQWCCDPHDQIADWWLAVLDEQLTKQREVVRETVEKRAKEKVISDLLDLLSVLPVREPLPQHLLAIDLHQYAKYKGIEIVV